MKHELFRTRTTDYKSKDRAFPIDTKVVYIGHLLCGYAVPTRGIDGYSFHSVPEIINVPSRIDLTLEEITDSCELSIKEFLRKVIK